MTILQHKSGYWSGALELILYELFGITVQTWLACIEECMVKI